MVGVQARSDTRFRLRDRLHSKTLAHLSVAAIPAGARGPRAVRGLRQCHQRPH